MSELRRAREAKGISLEDVSKRTRIPVKWLDALERGDTAAFPPGPFLAGYTRQYRSYLELPEKPVALAPAPEPPAPLREARPEQPEARAGYREARPEPPVDSRVAARPPARPPIGDPETDLTEAVRRQPEDVTETTAAFRRNTPRLLLVGGVAVLLLGVIARSIAGAFPDAVASLGVEPDQVVSLAIDDEMKVKVVADGRVIQDGPLPVTSSDAHVFRAHDRLEVSLPTLEGVRIRYNGEVLTPLGAQSRPRRLVFVDEAE